MSLPVKSYVAVHWVRRLVCLLALALGALGMSGTSALAQPPSISSTAITSIIALDQGFTLEGEVAGSLPMTITWRRNGVIVKEYLMETRSMGTSWENFGVDFAKASDAGTYILTASNAHGMASSKPMHIAIEPPSPPTLTLHPASHTVPYGTNLTLNVAATGSAPIQYYWMKDGVLISISPDLRFPHVSETTEGIYTVRAVNGYGSAESHPAQVKLDPGIPLRITAQPQNQHLLNPWRVDLEVKAVGPGTLSYQWYKDDLPLPDARSDRLWNAQPGTYKVTVATATERLTSSPAVVSVHPAAQLVPKLSPNHGAVIANPGHPVYLSVGVQTIPGTQFHVQWRHNGVDIPGQQQTTMWIYGVQLGDAGAYSLAFYHDGGVLISDDISLTVTNDPVVISRQPRDLEIESGGRGSISISIFGAWQTVHWERDGVTVPMSQDSTLFFGPNPGEAPAQAGIYRAVVTTDTGATVYSEPASVTVRLLTPWLVSGLAARHVALGAAVQFRAEVAIPLSFQWRKNGADIPSETNQYLILPPVRAEDVGTYSVALTNAAGTVLSNDAAVSLYDPPPPVISQQPASSTLPYGGELRLQTTILRPEPETSFQWYKDENPISGQTTSSHLREVTATSVGRYHVVVTNRGGSTRSQDAWVSILPGTKEPAFTLQPVAQHAAAGTQISLSAYATGYGTLSYQWQRDGVDIPGATSPTFSTPIVNASDTAVYSVTVTNDLGRTSSTPARLSVEPSGRLLNLSARAVSTGGDDTLIAGFVVQGPGSKRILVRAIGPTLSQFGVAAPLPNPKLEIYNSAGALSHSVEDWDTIPKYEPPAPEPGVISLNVAHPFEDAEIRERVRTLKAASPRVGAFDLPAGSKDAAVIVTLEPGNYTAHLKNAALSSPHVGLAELYDLDSDAPRMINISTRARVQPGQGALVAGFYVDQGAPKRLLIRAVGPGLAPFNVPDLLADPKLEIVRISDNTQVAANDNWSDADAAAMEANFKRVAAFDVTRGSKDAALVVTLPSGSYTATVTGSDGGSGQALVEVYEMPP